MEKNLADDIANSNGVINSIYVDNPYKKNAVKVIANKVDESKFVLRNYQKSAIKKLNEGWDGVVLLDLPPGTGKTNVSAILKNIKIGRWFDGQKCKIKSKNDELYKKFSVNEYLKKNIDQLFENRKNNIGNTKMTYDESKILLFEYCDKYKKFPPLEEVYKNVKIGRWLDKQKSKIFSASDEKYIELTKNKYVKNSIDTLLERRNKNKGSARLSFDECKNILFEYCDNQKDIPNWKTIHREKKIGSWLSENKKKIKNKNDEIYKILAKNKYVKEHLDTYLNIKNIK